MIQTRLQNVNKKMISINKYYFLKTINLYIQTLNAITYINDCYTLEQPENNNIITYVGEWLTLLKKELETNLIKTYQFSEFSEPINDELLAKEINLKYEMFNTIIENFRYVPIQPPFFTLRAMVEEAEHEPTIIPDPEKISNVYFKNIPQLNFTEKRMSEPDYHSEKPDNKREKIRNKVGGTVPHVLSMAVNYQYNPLMWPLLFHEYGHFVFMRKYKNDDIQNCISEIITEKEKLNTCLEVSEQDIKNCVNEVFSDLYAINCYSVNYFFAFFFCQMGDDASIDKMKSSSFLAHPPSIIRIEYMKKELKKRGYLEECDSLKDIMRHHDPYLKKKENKINTLFKKYQPIHDLIYEKISALFDKYKGYHFEKKETVLLCQFLDRKMPIGAYCKKTQDLKEIMNLEEIRKIMEKHEKKFNLDSETKIIDIIYVGWSYLITELFRKLYDEQRKYPIVSKSDDEDNFYKDYQFFIRNINYSIETSVIVSSYLGDHDI